MSTNVGLALILIASGTSTQQVSHAAEIKLFANAVAVARTVKEECPGVAINERHLEALRQRLHVVEADYPAYAPEARAVAGALHQGLAETPSAKAWCDGAIRLYGPDGTLIPGVLLPREPAKP